MRAGQALAATMLMLVQGPAHGAEELIEMSGDDAQWVMPAKNYASTRFSGLDQINTENVHNLQVAWSFSTGAEVEMYAGPGGHRGEDMAWDPVRREKVWTIEENFPVWSGTVVTAGDVAFYGTMDRWFKVVDARSGELLWQFRTGSGIIGQPITYLGPDGRQYVAILAGVGGWSGAIVAGGLDPKVPFGAPGFVGAMQDLPQHTAAGGVLCVFALPEQQQPTQ